jgi:hypothetical protein
MNHRPEVDVEATDTTEEHEHPMNHRPKVEGINREDNEMKKNMMMELKVVERERDGMVLTRQWTGDELVGSERSMQIQNVQDVTPHLHVETTVVRHDVECRREIKKRVKIG